MRAVQLKIPPPIVALVTAILMWLIARAAPMLDFGLPARHLLAACVAVAGVSIAMMGAAAFGRAGTTINPLRPERASSLVVSGIFKVTRNPMYLGLLLVLLAWGALLSNALALIMLPAFILYMNLFQIRAEEAALTAMFGKDFIQYKSHVRRWL